MYGYELFIRMVKIALLALLVILSQAVSHEIKLNQLDNVQSEGLSINAEVKAFLLELIKNAFVYNGNNPAANAFYISQKLNSSTYSGNWNTIIAVNCTYPSGYGAYSYQGSWWAYWAKVNEDALDWCYYLTRMPLAGGRYLNQTGDSNARGQGLTSAEEQRLSYLIEKGYSIYKSSQNGNAFFVSEEAGTALGGSWDVLVLNSTSQFYSSSYSVNEKWQIFKGTTQLNRKYFIRKVWNQS